MFGKYRIKIDMSKNSPLSSKGYYDVLTEMADWCDANVRDAITYPGPADGEVVWCFENEDDSILFALRWL